MIARTVVRVIEVVPKPIKFAIGALLALLIAAGASALRQTVRARRLTSRQGELLEEIDLFEAVLVSTSSVEVGSTVAASAHRPADGAAAGGDVCDVFELPDGRVGVVAASVTAGGIDGLSAATALRYTLRGQLASGNGPRDAIIGTSRGWVGPDGGAIATALCAVLDTVGGQLVYAVVGGPAPVVLGGPSPAPPPATTPLGMGEPDPHEASFRLGRGSSVLFFTSSVEEIRSDGEMIGREGIERLADELGDELNAEALLSRVASGAGSLPRDLAACVLEWHRDPEPSPVGRPSSGLDVPFSGSSALGAAA